MRTMRFRAGCVADDGVVRPSLIPIARRVLAGAALGALTACSAGPSTGTESGNPINPPTPPGEHANVASSLPPLDEPLPMVANEPVDVEDPGFEDPALEPIDGPEPVAEPPPPDDPVPIAQPSSTPDGPADGPGPQPMATMPLEPPPVGATGGMSSGEPPSPSPDNSMPSAPSTGAGGFGGDSGVPTVDACTDAACAEDAQAEVDQLRDTPLPVAYVGECGVGALNECRCLAEESETVVLRTSDECSLASPAGHCLYAGAEFAGCSAGPNVCQTACDELLQRQNADLAVLSQLVVRVSGCSNMDQCVFVLESGQSCWIGPELSAVDCNVGEDQVAGGGASP